MFYINKKVSTVVYECISSIFVFLGDVYYQAWNEGIKRIGVCFNICGLLVVAVSMFPTLVYVADVLL